MACHHIPLKLKEKLQRMAISAGSAFRFSGLHSEASLCPETETFLRGQSNDFLKPKGRTVRGRRCQKLWTLTQCGAEQWGIGLARPTPKSDRAGLCRFAIWHAWKAPVCKRGFSSGTHLAAAGSCDDLGARQMNLVCFCVSTNNHARSRS